MVFWKCVSDPYWVFFFFLPFFRKRAREEEIEAAEKAKRDREWQKNFEVCVRAPPSVHLQLGMGRMTPSRLNKRLWHDLKRICSNRMKESRDGRVDSWRSFQAQGKKSKEKKNRSFLKPPKVKMEQRD